MYFIHVTGQGSRRWNAVADGDDEVIREGNWPVSDDGVFEVLLRESRTVSCAVLHPVALCALDCAS